MMFLFQIFGRLFRGNNVSAGIISALVSKTLPGVQRDNMEPDVVLMEGRWQEVILALPAPLSGSQYVNRTRRGWFVSAA